MIRRVLIILVSIACVLPANGQNILDNPGFEAGLSSWSGTVTLGGVQAHSGTASAYYDAGSDYIEQIVTISPDSTYRLSCWIYLDSSFAGNDWGGVSISAIHFDWSGQYSGDFLTPQNRPVGTWFQEYLEFTPEYPQLRIRVAMFGGGGWVPRFYIDDVSLVQLGGANQPPEIYAVSATPAEGAAPLSVNVSTDIADPDGVLRLVQHEFGDGSSDLGETAIHTYYVAGSYTYTLTVVDDQGASATWQQVITVSEAGFPFVQIQTPTDADSIIVTDSVVTLGGIMNSSVESASWHNRRTGQSGAIAAQSEFTTQDIHLEPGDNWIDVQVRLPHGLHRSDALNIYYAPTGYAGPAIVDVAASTGTIGQYELWEVEFNLRSVATAPTLPFDDAPPQNLRAGAGVTVDAILSNGIQTLRWPAYPKARTVRHNGRHIPTGESVWCVRAAFRNTGLWSCVLEARDAVGSTSVVAPSVLVVPSDSRGFLRVSDDDDRYFEFDNGELYLPMGFGFPLTDADGMDEELQRWKENRINFSRLWLSSESPYSDPWCTFATHHPMSDNGYMPPPLVTTEEHFDDGDVSWALGAPAESGMRTPAIFRGFWHGAVDVLPGKTYRVIARVKTVNLTGTGGLVLKTGGWLGEQVIEAGIGHVVTSYLKGSNNWCYLQGEIVTGASQYELPNLYVVLEDVTGGNAYVDQVTLQEVRGDGTLSENILPKPNANTHYYLDAYRPLDYDYLIQAACTSEVYFKLVITEKDDRLLSTFDDHGFVNPFDGQFETARGSKSRRLMEYFWRHLIARWGYAVSVHSWELVNEGAPYSYSDLTNHLAAFIDSAGPYPRMVTTSFWAGWQPDYWNASLADYGDVHAYVMTTGWIDSVAVDGIDYNRTMLKEDPAAAVFAYSMQIGHDALRTKPVVIAETDLDMPGDQSPDPRLAQDTSGIWLHDFVWGHINSGGVSALIWNNSNILNNGLHGQFAGFMQFMNGTQLHEHNYVDLTATTNHANLRAWGQRDSLGTRAHVWIKNRLHTWANVLENGAPSPVSGAVSIPSMRSGNALVTWYDTDNGQPLATDTLAIGGSGVAEISVQNLQNDVAVKLESLASAGPYIEGVTIAEGSGTIVLRWPAAAIPCTYRVWYATTSGTPIEEMSMAATTTSTQWTDSTSVAQRFYVVECIPDE
ncbi:MAG: PKD domain-containing protein [bacterium]|nr:PKD domain-containing protein [bacterium]